jgi:hypothetical protein
VKARLTRQEYPDRIDPGILPGDRVAALRIECASRGARDGSQRITHVGGSGKNGVPWKILHEDAIRDIESGKTSYYCDAGGHSYLVIVARDKTGAKFIKAVIDGDGSDSLLKLPECP